MASVYKVLAQSKPLAASLTDLYVVGGSTSVSCSSIVVCNQNVLRTTFRVSVAVAGAADSDEQYIYYDVPIGGNDTFIATIGISLAATDKIRVYNEDAFCSFNLFGIEIT